MQKEKAERLLGQYLTHKKYGNVFVKDIVSAKEEKIIGIIDNTGEEKTFILSSNYFEDFGEIKFTKKFQEKKVKVQVKRERDLSKYRNHPLLRKIDEQEMRINKLYNTTINDDDDDDDDEDQD